MAPNLERELQSFLVIDHGTRAFANTIPSSTAMGAHNALGARIIAAKRARRQRTSYRIDNETSQVAMPISRW
jgi:hypothetical protein